MDKENAGRRALSQSATTMTASSSIHAMSAKLAVATKEGNAPKMGRDTAPLTLRLGKGSEDAPLLRFTTTRVGGSKTVPLRLRNDTPVTQQVRFERIPREEGFLVDPDRATLPPGAEELVRVSWLPARPSAGPYCGIMHAVLNDGVGGSAAALKIRLRAPPVPQISGNVDAAGSHDAAGAMTGRRASTASSVGSHIPHGPRRASVTAYGARRASALQPLSGNTAVRRRRAHRASLDESAPDMASPGFKRSRADCDRLYVEHASFDTGCGSLSNTTTSFTASEASAQRRRKLPKVAPVARTLQLRRLGEGADPGAEGADTACVPRPDFASFHTEFWVRQQEVAFTHWLNATIVPHTASASANCADQRARRLAANAARTRLWSLYSSDCEVREVILRVESHIDDGFLRLRGTEDDGSFKSGGSFLEDVR